MRYLITAIFTLSAIFCNQQISVNSQEKRLAVNNQSFTEIAQPTPNSEKQIKWMPATYKGITLGKSKYKDVKKLFGEPRWEGQNEDNLFETDSEFEILLQYPSDVVGKEAADIVIGEKTKTVKSISFSYPEMTRSEIVEKFGFDYFEIGTGDSLCIKENQKRGKSEQKIQYPTLVYPEKGMIVVLKENGEVISIGYLYKCFDYS